MNNQIRENKKFHASLKSAVIAYSNNKNVTWSCYFGDLLFPDKPNGEEQFKGLFNQTKLTSWQISLILQEIGEYAYLILHNEKAEGFKTETQFKDEALSLMSEIGTLSQKTMEILKDEDNTFDADEAKKIAVYTQKLLTKALQIHLKTEKAKE